MRKAVKKVGEEERRNKYLGKGETLGCYGSE